MKGVKYWHQWDLSSALWSQLRLECASQCLRAAIVIVIATILAPTIAEYAGADGALAEYSSLLGAVIVMSILGVIMVAVRLISTRY